MTSFWCLTKFHALFCFYCWLWTNKWRLVLSFLASTVRADSKWYFLFPKWSFSKKLLCVLHDTCFQRVIIIIVTLCAICYHFCNFNNVKSTHGGVLLLVKFLVLLKVTLLHGCFLRSLSYTNITKLRKASLLYLTIVGKL